MELKQKLELRKVMAPQLAQSLNILALPLLEIKNLIEAELEDNPFLEESQPSDAQIRLGLLGLKPSPPFKSLYGVDFDPNNNLVAAKVSLQDVLLRQLGMFTHNDDDFKIGQDIIGNIDENGYLRANLEEIAANLNVSVARVDRVLKLIQEFEPAGVCARTVPECLLIQLRLLNETDPLLFKVVECHLEDVAKKKYSTIAKALKEPQDKIEPLIKKILRLNPKPGRNYSVDQIQRIIPDIMIYEKDEDGPLEIVINNEDISLLSINNTYKDMLSNNKLDPQTKEFLKDKLHSALELLRSFSKRQDTLRRIVEIVARIQSEAIKNDLSSLRPLTFQDVAKEIDMHETTICRAVMNKYVQAPCGTVALKDLFSNHVHDKNGQGISPNYIKKLIGELIKSEDKKHPLSDKDICDIISRENSLNISRRTVAKYREGSKILSSVFRRER